ncbi:hypothetical protein [Spiroplasma alleghenense]|uniref:Uncharacterized protein n=1 Tax=Spiroplasma alleghenense TaxID=216931 RepID=A0A345Z3K3_9MOLU|nr:hypothetical protein [Spiroplasma alleghenense]AXK51182.1 hypothetical protein SALLE_v1c05080 [Spiroplasma alleghenense]
MSQKINEVINFKPIIREIILDDLKSLKNNKSNDFIVNKGMVEEFQKITKKVEPKDFLNDLEALFEKLAKEESFNEAMVISQFIQRYHYFYQTYVNYNNFTDPISAESITNPTATFESIYVPFFSKQIDFYFDNFLAIVRETKLSVWNEVFSTKLNNKISTALTEKDFIEKIARVEEFVLWLQTNSFVDLKSSSLELDSDQQIFLTQLNELKIVLQSVDILVERVLKRVVEVAND